MILKDFIDNNKTKKLKLGCDKGSGFVYCGLAERIYQYDYLNNLMDRNLESIYKSIFEKDVLIIIIKGTERSSYWTTEDFKKDKKPSMFVLNIPGRKGDKRRYGNKL